MASHLMTKKEMKAINIVDMVIHRLSCSPDVTGEWITRADIDFILSESIQFTVFDRTYTIDRLKFYYDFDLVYVFYANEHQAFSCLQMPKLFTHKVLQYVEKEQEDGGRLEDWSFEDELLDLLQAEPLNYI